MLLACQGSKGLPIYRWIYRDRSTPITRFVGRTWDPSGADRTKVGPILAPWTLQSGHDTNVELPLVILAKRHYWNQHTLRMVSHNVPVFDTYHSNLLMKNYVYNLRCLVDGKAVVPTTLASPQWPWLLFCCSEWNSVHSQWWPIQHTPTPNPHPKPPNPTPTTVETSDVYCHFVEMAFWIKACPQQQHTDIWTCMYMSPSSVR